MIRCTFLALVLLLPDGQMITVDNERFQCPKVLSSLPERFFLKCVFFSKGVYELSLVIIWIKMINKLNLVPFSRRKKQYHQWPKYIPK